MMINVAIHSSIFSRNNTLNLLDPVAGKGTTLFEASTYGHHAFGIEVDAAPLQEGQTFLKNTWRKSVLNTRVRLE